MALRQEKNPAESLYKIAQARGYKKADPTPGPDDKKAKEAERALKEVASGIDKASKTLSDAGEEEKKTSLNSLMDASDEDFDKMWKDMEKSGALGS